jgi:hypothetical protein
MSTVPTPYALPAAMSPQLMRVYSYWESLRRAENNMPFADDLKLSALPDLTDSLLLIDVFADPERFRFNTVGKQLNDSNARALKGKFADEVALRGPLAFLRSQASATVEGRLPTLYRHDASPPYSRLLLPTWGDGQIKMLLGALELR